MTQTRVLEGREVARAIESEAAARARALTELGRPPGLATLLVGDDPASAIYVRNKHRAAKRAGIASFDHRLPRDATQTDVEAAVSRLNQDPTVDAFIVQLPLPDGLDEQAVVEAIEPGKDADGLHPVNLGRLLLDRAALKPATPTGILRMLDHYGIPTQSARITVVGRSFLVGKPLAIMLGAKGRDGTVTTAHSRTTALAELTRASDIVVAAAGRPSLITADHISRGAVLIDVGTTRRNGRLLGDVDAESVGGIAGAITPVPGGVGPVTVASLLLNTVVAAERRRSRSDEHADQGPSMAARLETGGSDE